jgi:hypothetical protein
MDRNRAYLRRRSRKNGLSLLLLNSSTKFVFLHQKYWQPSSKVSKIASQAIACGYLPQCVPVMVLHTAHPEARALLPGAKGHRRRLRQMWRQMPFKVASPFQHSCGRESGYVIAFEVEWAHVCGLDYSNPLCQDGRVVVEATHVIKREFQSVSGCLLRPAMLWPHADLARMLQGDL